MQTQQQTPNDKIQIIDNQIAKNNKSIKTSRLVNISVWTVATIAAIGCSIFTAGIAQWFIPVMAGCSALLTTRICTELSSQLKSSNKSLESEKSTIKHSLEKQAKQQKIFETEKTETTKPHQTAPHQPQVQSQNETDTEEISIA